MNFEDFSGMSVQHLAEKCIDETRKFRQRIISDTRYCFELLCRAFRDGNEAALSNTYIIYLPLLTAKARNHPLFLQSCQNGEFFARSALANAYNATKGEKFLKKFSQLERVIAYWHTCIHTAVLQDVEDNSSIIPLDDDRLTPASTVSQDAELEMGDLWSHITKLLPDEHDQLLARLYFILEMKPAEIAQQYQHIWATYDDVRAARQRIMRHLRADPYLNSLAGLDQGSDDSDDQDSDQSNSA